MFKGEKQVIRRSKRTGTFTGNSTSNSTDLIHMAAVEGGKEDVRVPSMWLEAENEKMMKRNLPK